MSEDPATETQNEDAEPATVAATEVATITADVDELAPNGGGTSGNHGNGTAG